MATVTKYRRRYERVGFYCDLLVTPTAGGEAVPARSVDISLGGVGVVAAVSWPRGELVRIGFHLKDSRQQPVVEEVTGRIAHCRAEEDGNILGVEFLEPISAAAQPALARRLQAL